MVQKRIIKTKVLVLVLVIYLIYHWRNYYKGSFIITINTKRRIKFISSNKFIRTFSIKISQKSYNISRNFRE